MVTLISLSRRTFCQQRKFILLFHVSSILLRNGFENNKITLKSILCYCDIAFWWCWWWWGGWDGVLMFLMLVINPWNCLFRIRKHCCFCVCSSRVDVRMSAAWGGKFYVNIFCFRDPQHCVVFTFPRLPQETCFSRFKLNDLLLWAFKTSCVGKTRFNICVANLLTDLWPASKIYCTPWYHYPALPRWFSVNDSPGRRRSTVIKCSGSSDHMD